MVVLGIDPGVANCGFGVVRRRSGRLVALDGGVVTTRAQAPLERRLAEIPQVHVHAQPGLRQIADMAARRQEPVLVAQNLAQGPRLGW